jgi:alpha-tubulin suppressor-like RCC1 family protein
VPTPVLSLAGRRVVSVCTRSDFSMAITDDGHVFSWGAHDQWSLPGYVYRDGQPVPIEGALIVDTDADPMRLLDPPYVPNGNGQLVLYEPRCIEALAGHATCRVSASDYHCMALTTNGSVYSWGCAYVAALGHPACEDVSRRFAAGAYVSGHRDDDDDDDDDDDNDDNDVVISPEEEVVCTPTEVIGVRASRMTLD